MCFYMRLTLKTKQNTLYQLFQFFFVNSGSEIQQQFTDIIVTLLNPGFYLFEAVVNLLLVLIFEGSVEHLHLQINKRERLSD